MISRFILNHSPNLQIKLPSYIVLGLAGNRYHSSLSNQESQLKITGFSTSMSIDVARAVKSVTAIEHYPNHSVWISMSDKTDYLTHGSQYNPLHKSLITQSFNHTAYNEYTETVVKLLPKSDVYVLQSLPSRRPGSNSALSISYSQQLLLATLVGQLAGKYENICLIAPQRLKKFSKSAGGEVDDPFPIVRNIIDSGMLQTIKMRNVEAIRAMFEIPQSMTITRKKDAEHFRLYQSLLCCLCFILDALGDIKQDL